MAGIIRKKGKKPAASRGDGQKRLKRWQWCLLVAALFVILAYFFHRPFIMGLTTAYRAAGRSVSQEEQRRGTIYDRNFVKLAVSRKKVSVLSRAREITSFEETAARLSLVLEQSREELLKNMKEASRAILASGISREQAEQITAMDLPGISIVHAPGRSYPQETVAGHLIGYAENDIGLSGVEYAYDRVPLLFARRLKKAGIPPGHLPDVQLTLDLKIQDLMETLVKTISGSDRRARVGAYVLDLARGEIRAAAQWPPINPNTYEQYGPDDLSNAITEVVPVPEKFRLFLRDTAKLQNHFENGKSILPWSVSAENRSRGNAPLGSEQVLWKGLGFNDTTRPDFANQESADHGEKNHYFCPSFSGGGYGSAPESLSPLQFLTGLGILANNGLSLRPFALAAALNPDDRDKEKRVPVNLANNQIPTEAVPEVVAREAISMFSAMAVSTAENRPILYDQVTCQESGTGKASLARHQLYAAVVPGKNPEYVLVVNVRKSGSAVPTEDERNNAVAEINVLLDRVLMFIEVGRGLEDYATPSTDSSDTYLPNRDDLREQVRRTGDQKEVLVAPKQWLMPEIMAGISLRRGLRRLKGAPCRIEITGSGDVLRQSPVAGTVLKDGSVCQLILRNPADITIDRIKMGNTVENTAVGEVPGKADKKAKAKSNRKALFEKTRAQIKAEARTPP